MVPCINKPECKPPKPKMIDVDLSYLADREVLSMARDDMDGDTDHTPLLPKPNQKRKRKAAADTRVRRRLEVDQVQVQNDTSDKELGSAPTRLTTCCPSSPKGPATHHQAVREFAASLDVMELRTIVTELLFWDQGAFEHYRLGYRPYDDPPRQPQPDDLPRWCRCGNCRPMPSAQVDKCCWQAGSSQCVVDGPNFYTVISPAVLDIAMAHYNDFFVHDQERNNAAYRHQTYRQFTLQRFRTFRSWKHACSSFVCGFGNT